MRKNLLPLCSTVIVVNILQYAICILHYDTQGNQYIFYVLYPLGKVSYVAVSISYDIIPIS